MAARKLGANCASSNVVRLRRRRRKPGPRCEAEIIEFPDKLGIQPPPFDPANPFHVSKWHAIWNIMTLEHARHAPEGHPLRAWYQAEFAKTFPPVLKRES